MDLDATSLVLWPPGQLEQPKERLITTLISPFISCSARLPIYSLFVAAFFPKNQALIVLSIYFLGIAVALGMAKFYQLIFNVDDSSVFIVELPQYHIPRVDIIWRGTWDKGKGFIKKAGTIIFAGTVLIWLLSSFGTSGLVSDIDNSFAATLGKTLLPLFAPLGVTAWQVISALFTGIVAKEVISSRLMVMFHSANQAGLSIAMRWGAFPHRYPHTRCSSSSCYVSRASPRLGPSSPRLDRPSGLFTPSARVWSLLTPWPSSFTKLVNYLSERSLIHMALFVNFLIIALIIGAAGYQIYRVVKRAKKGKCAACDYDCEAKKMLNKAQKQQN